MKRFLLFVACSLFLSTGFTSNVLISNQLTSSGSTPVRLKTFDQVWDAMRDGVNFQINVQYNQCIGKDRKFFEDLGLGIINKPATFTPSNNNITTSVMYFTRANPMFPKQSIFVEIRYQLLNDTMTLTGTILDAATYQPLTDENEIYCKIEKGVFFYVLK